MSHNPLSRLQGALPSADFCGVSLKMSSRAKTRELTAQMTQKIKRALAPLKGEPRYRVRFAQFFAARSASERSERLQQESSPQATPLKAVSRLPSAGDSAERVSSVFQSDSLSSRAQMSHYAECVFALCTLHFQNGNRRQRRHLQRINVSRINASTFYML